MELSVPTWVWVLLIGASIGAAALVSLGVFLVPRSPESPTARRTRAVAMTAVLLGAWLAAVLLLAGGEVFRARQGAFPVLALGVFVPVLAVLAILLSSSTGRAVADGLPGHWLVGAHAARVIGGIFLILYAQDRLPAAFAIPAGVGDVAVAAAAPLVAYRLWAGRPGSRGLAVAFNAAGLADFAVALGTGFLAAPSSFRLLATVPSTEAMSVLPLVLIPAFLVPILIIGHVLSLRQLRRGPRREAAPSGPAGSPFPAAG